MHAGYNMQGVGFGGRETVWCMRYGVACMVGSYDIRQACVLCIHACIHVYSWGICLQVQTPHKAKVPLSNESWSIDPKEDRARGTITFENLRGLASHTRAVVYRRGMWWVVVDRIVSDRPRDVEALWHAHPRCTVTLTGGPQAGGVLVAHVVHNATYVGLDVVPASSAHAPQWSNVTVIKGRNQPGLLQGWYGNP